MSENPQISKICGDGQAVLNVLFVHGLTGNCIETWVTDPAGEYWPQWICEEFPGASVYELGYPSSVFAKWAKKEMDLQERATNLLELLVSNGIGDRPIAIVAHRLGGILAKEMLRIANECSDDDWREIAAKTRLVVFLATPHTGAALASAVKLIAPRLASAHVALLANEAGYLMSLTQSYRDLVHTRGITTVSYYEKYKTKGALLVVSPASADPGVGTSRPIAVDADHIPICKPSDREALLFTSFCRHIGTVLKDCQPAASVDGGSKLFTPDDYSTASDSDRRDLLQKLIDAGREHEYQRANNRLNKFAQSYYKLGLYTDARCQADAVLSSVEQRFITHVYTNKTCRGASDDEIARALQEHVMDALTTGGALGQGPSSAAILQALYFLTEQCYVQWDAP